LCEVNIRKCELGCLEGGAFDEDELFENDAKNTFMFPMASPGKLNEVE
jgi:hypothetical protein